MRYLAAGILCVGLIAAIYSQAPLRCAATETLPAADCHAAAEPFGQPTVSSTDDGSMIACGRIEMHSIRHTQPTGFFVPVQQGLARNADPSIHGVVTLQSEHIRLQM